MCSREILWNRKLFLTIFLPDIKSSRFSLPSCFGWISAGDINISIYRWKGLVCCGVVCQDVCSLYFTSGWFFSALLYFRIIIFNYSFILFCVAMRIIKTKIIPMVSNHSVSQDVPSTRLIAFRHRTQRMSVWGPPNKIEGEAPCTQVIRTLVQSALRKIPKLCVAFFYVGSLF